MIMYARRNDESLSTLNRTRFAMFRIRYLSANSRVEQIYGCDRRDGVTCDGLLIAIFDQTCALYNIMYASGGSARKLHPYLADGLVYLIYLSCIAISYIIILSRIYTMSHPDRSRFMYVTAVVLRIYNNIIYYFISTLPWRYLRYV